MQVYDNDDLMEVKGHQRSNVVNYALWLPNLVRKIPDACMFIMMMTFMQVKVIKGQMW